MKGVLTGGPRLTGADQAEKRGASSPSAAPVRVRVEIQMSLPRLPARSDANRSVRPSNDRLGWSSAADALTRVPTWSGAAPWAGTVFSIDIQSSARAPT